MIAPSTVVRSSYREWVDQEVLPLQKLHPTWHRLDGWANGGNRKVVGRFQHGGRTWQVHADTRFDPVLRAYQEIIKGALDPFIVKPAKVRDCLDLSPKLKNPNQPKYFYVYS